MGVSATKVDESFLRLSDYETVLRIRFQFEGRVIAVVVRNHTERFTYETDAEILHTLKIKIGEIIYSTMKLPLVTEMIVVDNSTYPKTWLAFNDTEFEEVMEGYLQNDTLDGRILGLNGRGEMVKAYLDSVYYPSAK